MIVPAIAAAIVVQSCTYATTIAGTSEATAANSNNWLFMLKL
jgi:hypothetical protein